MNNFPDAYIYPKEDRPLRDLMRKRSLLVRTKTQYMLSFINLVNRNLGIKIGGNKVKQLSLSDQEVDELLEHEYWCPYAQVYYKHKLKESGIQILAAKALASKIARASYHVLTTDEPYNPEKVFERYKAEAHALISQKQKGRGSKPDMGSGANSNSSSSSNPVT